MLTATYSRVRRALPGGEDAGRVLTLVRYMFATGPRLAVAISVIAAVNGLLLPTFMVASGALIGAVRAGAGIVLPLGIVAGVFVAQRLLEPVSEETSAHLGWLVEERVEQQLMKTTSSPPGVAHLEDPAIADLLLQAQGTIHDISPGRAVPSLVSVFTQVVQGVGALLVVGTYSWLFGGLLLAAYGAGFALTRRHFNEVTLVIYGRTDRLRRAYYLRTTALSSRAAKEIRIFDLSRWLVERYRDTWFEVMRSVWRRRSEGWVLSLALVAFLGGAEAIVLLRLAGDALNGAVGVGRALAVAQAVVAIGFAARYDESHWMLGRAARALSTALNLDATITARGAIPTVGRSAWGLPQTGIKFESVTFAYPGRSDTVVDGLNLEIPAGRSLAIVGGNGAGKTTIVKLLARLHDPSDGRVTVDGVDLRSVSAAAWQRRVAAVFQDYVEYEISAFDNVAFGGLEVCHDRDAVLAAAADASILHVIDRLPDGWQTTLSREFTGGVQLSGGEWQRLALARALLAVRAGAGLLILDEPTASLDVRAEAELYDRFLDLTRGVTTILISHRFSTVRRADRIVVIDGGRVVETGSHATLVADGGLYARMYALQARRFTDSADA